jgi:hypothetical protein
MSGFTFGYRNEICGIINVANAEADDLQRHGTGAYRTAEPAAMARVLLRAARRGR